MSPLVALLALGLAPAAEPVVWSPEGPGVGHTALALGGKLWLLQDHDALYPIPMVGLELAHGLNEDFDFVLHADTIAVMSLAEAGLRARAWRSGAWTLGVSGALGFGLGFGKNAENDARVSGLVGLIPGIAASVRGGSLYTFGLDVPILLATAGFDRTGATTLLGHDVFWRPSVTLEIPETDASVFVRVELNIPVNFASANPAVSVGYTW